MQDPDLLRRRPTRASSLAGFALACLAAAAVASPVMLGPCATGPDLRPFLQRAPELARAAVISAVPIAVVAAIVLAAVVGTLSRLGVTAYRMFPVVGVSIGVGSAVVASDPLGMVICSMSGAAASQDIAITLQLRLVFAGLAFIAATLGATPIYRLVAGFDKPR